MYEAEGSVQDVVNYVASIHNQVAVLYANEQINLTISGILVWTNSDPYTANNTSDVLNKFKEYRTSFNGDLAHLLTFRDIGGGRAYVDEMKIMVRR